MRATIIPVTAKSTGNILRSSAGQIVQQVGAVAQTTGWRFVGCLATVDRSEGQNSWAKATIVRAKLCSTFATREEAAANLLKQYDW